MHDGVGLSFFPGHLILGALPSAPATGIVFSPGRHAQATGTTRKTAWEGCTATSHQTPRVPSPSQEIRYRRLPLKDMLRVAWLVSDDQLFFAGSGKAGHLPVKWPCEAERDPNTSAAGWSPHPR